MIRLSHRGFERPTGTESAKRPQVQSGPDKVNEPAPAAWPGGNLSQALPSNRWPALRWPAASSGLRLVLVVQRSPLVSTMAGRSSAMITSPLHSWRIRFVHCSDRVGLEGQLLIAALARLVGAVRAGRGRERETRRSDRRAHYGHGMTGQAARRSASSSGSKCSSSMRTRRSASALRNAGSQGVSQGSPVVRGIPRPRSAASWYAAAS